jgi:hypothetical protein
VNAPAGRALHTVHVLRHDRHGQNFPHSIDKITLDTPVIVVFDKTP